MKVERKVFGNSVGLDLVVPRRNDSDYGELESIAYNSLLGAKETVNIPILWVDDEVYVLIDGIYKALGELLIKPRVTGNMEKIPYYVCLKYGLEEKTELIDTDEVFVDVDGEKKYFNQVLKTPEGMLWSSIFVTL